MFSLAHSRRPDTCCSLKRLASRLATYLCRMGPNCASGMLAKISSGEKYQYKHEKECFFDCHLPGCGGFTEYFSAALVRTTLDFLHLQTVDQHASSKAALLDMMSIS